MIEKIKQFILQDVHITDVLFSCIWLFGWFNNADQAVKYDLNSLTVFYGAIRVYILAGRVNESVNNSNKGEKPQ
jgi:hypothetical protein